MWQMGQCTKLCATALYLVSLVDKAGIHEIWTLNLAMKININHSQKQ